MSEIIRKVNVIIIDYFANNGIK